MDLVHGYYQILSWAPEQCPPKLMVVITVDPLLSKPQLFDTLFIQHSKLMIFITSLQNCLLFYANISLIVYVTAWKSEDKGVRIMEGLRYTIWLVGVSRMPLTLNTFQRLMDIYVLHDLDFDDVLITRHSKDKNLEHLCKVLEHLSIIAARVSSVNTMYQFG